MESMVLLWTLATLARELAPPACTHKRWPVRRPLHDAESPGLRRGGTDPARHRASSRRPTRRDAVVLRSPGTLGRTLNPVPSTPMAEGRHCRVRPGTPRPSLPPPRIPSICQETVRKTTTEPRKASQGLERPARTSSRAVGRRADPQRECVPCLRIPRADHTPVGEMTSPRFGDREDVGIPRMEP